MIENKSTPDLLFEVSWEVCNKVGGIYTVLSTRAKTLQKLYKDKVIFIGPDVWSEDNKSLDFSESKSLLKAWRSVAKLPEGVNVRVGRWDVPGKPIVILVSFNSLFESKGELYAQMWEYFGVDSLHGYGDYDEACMFAYASALVIESYNAFIASENMNVIAHFNEWTTGMGLLYLKANVPSIATIFTTHATSIGRSICGNNKPLYDYMKGYNGDQMAAELNMESKHSLEKRAAKNADCFTTVSDVTAVECEQLLERVPSIVTPNGFEQNFVPTKTKYPAVRAASREKLLNVASSLLGYKVADDAFIVATSGRHEFRNKGLDLFIDTLNRIKYSGELKREIIAFIMVPAWVDKAREDLKAAMANDNKQAALANNIITHSLHNYSSDAVCGMINYLGLTNLQSDKVKVIYVPSYLNGNDGIFDASYYDLLPGFDLTAFASYYEPWGYTPLESVAFGIPTITTSLSGYGQWVNGSVGNGFDVSGTSVIERTDSNYMKVVESMANDITELAKADSERVTRIAKAAMDTSKAAAWSNFIEFYKVAYKIAIDSAKLRNN